MPIQGRFTGAVTIQEQGVSLTIDFYWQVVTPEYIVGYLSSTFDASGFSCAVSRPYELRHAG